MTRDPFARAEVRSQRWLAWGPVWATLLVLLLVALAVGPRSGQPGPRQVVLYAAQDRVYAEPILQAFEHATGIPVRTIYDSEAVKTVALANRLLAEQAHPQCDVFWGNEEMRTRQLADRGVFRETNGWAAFGYRQRQIARRQAGEGPTPSSWLDLTNTVFRRRIALAYPLFGTTAAHFLALRQHWGEANWRAWCQALAANEPFIVDGNSVAVQFVVRGEARLALTDSDDIRAAVREGADLAALPPTAETLLIPNTVAVIRHSPHPVEAELLFQYLQTPAVAERLVAAGALEGVRLPADAAPTLRPDWPKLLRDLPSAVEEMKSFFRK